MWRKLREKLSNHLADGCPRDKVKNKLDRFLSEAKELTEGFELPHPLPW